LTHFISAHAFTQTAGTSIMEYFINNPFIVFVLTLATIVSIRLVHRFAIKKFEERHAQKLMSHRE
jgi:hypothetical protein